MQNVTGSDRHMAEQDDRKTPDAGSDPRREEIRGVGDESDDLDEDEDDLEDDEEDEGAF